MLLSLLLNKISYIVAEEVIMEDRKPLDIIKKPQVVAGIDLGTTFSVCAFCTLQNMQYGFLNFSKNHFQNILPSTVYIKDNKTFAIGHDANSLNQQNPSADRYYYGFKRLMGLTYDSPKVIEFKKHVTFDVSQQFVKNGGLSIPVFNFTYPDNTVNTFTPTTLSSFILKFINDRLSETYEIMSVVVTTPAHFTVNQDAETKKAAVSAGFKNPIILKEPTAAAIDWAVNKNSSFGEERKILVMDIGGGTSDVSLLDAESEKTGDSNDKKDIFTDLHVISYTGNNYLGGEDINQCLIEHFRKNVTSTLNLPTLNNKQILQLRMFIEEFKIKSCDAHALDPNTPVIDQFFLEGYSTPILFSLTKKEFDVICKPVYTQIRKLLDDPIEGIFKNSNQSSSVVINPNDVGLFILVGGCTRVPKIREIIMEFKPDAVISDELNVDLAVANGACIFAFNNYSEDGTLSVVDAVPLPIGIKLYTGAIEVIVKAGTPLPCSFHKMFSNITDFQRVFSVQIGTGKRPKYEDNKELGVLTLTVDHPKARGGTQLKVEIHIDSGNKMTVTATDADHPENTISTKFDEAYKGLTQDAIKELLEDAERNEEADAEVSKKLELINQFTYKVDTLESVVNTRKLDEETNATYAAIVKLHKEFLTSQAQEATLEQLKGRMEELDADLKSLEKVVESKMEEQKGQPEATDEATEKAKREAL